MSILLSLIKGHEQFVSYFPQVISNGLIASSTILLVAVAFGLIYSTTRFFHFAHGIVFTAAAYGVYAAFVVHNLPFAVAVVIGIGLAAGLGVAIDRAMYLPLRKRDSPPLVFLLASLGVYIVLQNLISLTFGDDTKSVRFWPVREGLNILGARITPVQIVIIASAIMMMALLVLLLKRTKLGKMIRAVASDPELAMVCGIPTERVILWVFAIGSAMAGVAGILVALDVDMNPTMGMRPLMMGVVAVIIGGVGSIPGTALGALLLGMAQHLAAWKISSQWQDAIAFAILLMFLLFRPQGFFGKRIRKAEV